MHTRLCNFIRIFAVMFMLQAFTSSCSAESLDAALNEQVIRVPVKAGLWNVDLETTVFKPPGSGPFPLLVMNHGKARGNTHLQQRARYLVISREFVKRGYAVVIPMRRGFAGSGGNYVESACNISGNGDTQADDVQGILEYLVAQPWVDANRIVIAGQSHGGLTAIAFGTRRFPGVRGLINFAGGLRKDQGNCQWKQSLVHAFANYGAKSNLPSIWFYGENDSYFGPELVKQMYAAYTEAGGKAALVAYGPFREDAHSMSSHRDGVQIWLPPVEKFLQEIGLPTAQTVTLPNAANVAATDFASIADVDAVPYVKNTGKDGYRAFLEKAPPRAFAISSSGAWGWSSSSDDPGGKAIANCRKHGQQPCRLYAVDNDVVWEESP